MRNIDLHDLFVDYKQGRIKTRGLARKIGTKIQSAAESARIAGYVETADNLERFLTQMDTLLIQPEVARDELEQVMNRVHTWAERVLDGVIYYRLQPSCATTLAETEGVCQQEELIAASCC